MKIKKMGNLKTGEVVYKDDDIYMVGKGSGRLEIPTMGEMEEIQIMEVTTKKETKLYPYQIALLAAIAKRKSAPIAFNYERTKQRRYSSDILTTSKMLGMVKGEVLRICTPNGDVKFECISNDIM